MKAKEKYFQVKKIFLNDPEEFYHQQTSKNKIKKPQTTPHTHIPHTHTHKNTHLKNIL